MHGPAITSYYTLSDPDAPSVGAAERKRIASIPAAWHALACSKHSTGLHRGIVVVAMPGAKE